MFISPNFKYLTALMPAAGLSVALSSPGVAQAQPKPIVPTPSTATIEREFVSPPAAARPWVYWFVMDGNFTKQGITADLEAMARGGIGGLIFMEVNVGIPRGPVAFMSPQWQDLWAHAVRESERLGIQLTLNGGPGWTGSGGPWVKADRSMRLLTSASLDVTGPQNFNGALPRPANRSTLSDLYEDVRVLAFPKPSGNQRIADVNQKSFLDRQSTISGGGSDSLPSFSNYPALPASEVVNPRQVVDLSAKLGADGRLNWEVPPGEWTILRFGSTNNGHSTLPAPASGLGMESDKFSKAGLNAHFNDFIGPLLKKVGPRVISPDRGWNNLHIDSWEVGTQNWTPGFLAEFQRRRGYDALPYFPALSGIVVGNLETSERFLWDWRQTCQDLVVENHVAYFKEIGRRNGFGLSIEAYDKVMASDLSLGAPADVPMGEFWAYDPPPSTTFTVFEAASIAHTNGGKIVGAESFTSGGSARWRAYPGSLKGLGDWAFSSGINRFVFHRYQHQPDLDKFPGMTMGPFGIHWERTQTWWDLVPAYHRYLSRSQYLLRQGLPISDVGYVVTEGSPQVFRAPDTATKGSPPERLGYSFDGIAPEIVINRMTVKNRRLTLPDGTSYQVLVLPERDTMTPGLLTKISQLVAGGATVIGPRPRKSPSLSGGAQSDATVQRLAAGLWGNADGIKVTENRFGQGRVIWKRDADKANDLSRPRPSPLTGAQWIWHNEGAPASSAPPGKRTFRRTVTIDNAAQLSSASIALTADNSFDLTVNGQRVGEGNDWRAVYSFDVTRQLKAGQNLFTVVANNETDSPSPAGFIAVIRLKYRDGRVVEIPTDNQWQSTADADSTMGAPALPLGALGIGPWNLSSTLPSEQYGDFGIVASTLQEMKVPMDFESDGPVRYIHRRAGDADLYFVANREDRLVDANCTFRVTGKVPELWNPVTGERRSLPQYSAKAGRITVPLRFEPLQSWFVVFRTNTQRAKTQGAVNFPALQRVGEVSGAWQVSFDPKWGGPAQTTFSTLTDWSKNSQDGIRFYSGKAVYRKNFVAPLIRSKSPLFLDLGEVKNLAQVRLNGRDMGTLWTAPWRVDISSALRPGANQLEITVANLWPNRLIGDQSLPAEKRFTSTTWNPYQAGDPLLPSGLLGPVRLLQAR